MKNKQFKNYGLILFITLFCSVSVSAQHDHGSHGASHTTKTQQPPHGGVIKEVGKYKIEMVAEMFLKVDQLRFYLFKSNFKPILNDNIKGTVSINSNGKTTTQPLQVKGTDFFVAQFSQTNSFQVTVEFIIKGKTISRVFSVKGYGDNKKE